MEEFNDAKFTEDILREREAEINAIDSVLTNVKKITDDMAQLVVEGKEKVGISWYSFIGWQYS